METSNTSVSAVGKIHKLLNDNYSAIKELRNCGLAPFFDELEHILKYNEKLVLKSVAEFENEIFRVDSYQRGYKWTSQQVRDLLEDINDFKPSGKNFYCLQPVVVKYHEPEDGEPKGVWELIDGQQRTTTIFMILHYLDGSNPYEIRYNTRTGSSAFLNEKLAETLFQSDWSEFIANQQDEHIDNVDNYHFFSAYHEIHKFFNETLGNDTDKKDALRKKLLHETRVIWYDATGTETERSGERNTNTSIDIFTRLNSGKIPLENAELIKALFLTSVSSTESDLQKQIELAKEWDDFETALQDPELWFFLKDDADNSDTNRITLVFELALEKLRQEYTLTNNAGNDNFKLFRIYADLLKHNPCKVDAVWNAIRTTFYTVREWFVSMDTIDGSLLLYHAIGFLITAGKSSNELYKLYCECESKEQFKEAIAKAVSNSAPEQTGDKKWDELSYLLSDDKRKLQRILLLFNLRSMGQGTRFSFYRFKNELWSIEHIHAQRSLRLDQDAEKQSWLSDMTKRVTESEDSNERKEILTHLSTLESNWDNDIEKNVKEQLFQFFGDDAEEVHTIENLALLDKDTNASLNNAYFSDKRQKIIEADKQGKFIPIATKNVFLKYYTPEVGQFHKWGKHDREHYVNAIEEILFSGGSSTHEN